MPDSHNIRDCPVPSPSKSSRSNKSAKSRRGCRQCKIRKLKCDEREPECLNCSRRGLQCPGYRRELRWSSKHERSQNAGSLSLDSVSPRTPTPTGIADPTPQSPSVLAAGSVNELLPQPASLGSPAAAHKGNFRMLVPRSGPAVFHGVTRDAGTDLSNTQWTDTFSLESSPASGVTALFSSESDFGNSYAWDELLWLGKAYDVSQDSADGEQEPVQSREDSTTTSISSDNCTARDLEHSPNLALSSSLRGGPTDLSTTLVEYWFSHVCPMWSAFDSEINYNRKVPLDTWTTSEPVFYTLQAMSAACLADSVPQISAVLPSLIQQAICVIKQRTAAVHRSLQVPTANITIDLLFAVFAMGTSIHWTGEDSLYGDALFHDAKEVLGLWAKNLTAVDALVHAYFHQALTYWEMLSSLIGTGSNRAQLDQKRVEYRNKMRQVLNLEGSKEGAEQPPFPDASGVFDGIKPHSWCGVSSEVVNLFGQVLALCRSSRARSRKRNKSTLEAASDVLCDIGLARDLQRRLLDMEFNATLTIEEFEGLSLETGDEKTPISDLIQVAEAYRQASLIQLCLTFDDLAVLMPQQNHVAVGSAPLTQTFSKDEPRTHQLASMSLRLISILKQIPAGSGSRCMQPVLLILAAAGLRYCAAENSQHPVATNEANASSSAPTHGYVYRSSETAYRIPPCNVIISSDNCDSQNLFRKKAAPLQGLYEVAEGRQFITSRLLALRKTLPPRPIQIALDLVKAIWTAYDGVKGYSDDADWLDIMNDTGLKTLFS